MVVPLIYDKIFDTIIAQNGDVFNGKIILTDENISAIINVVNNVLQALTITRSRIMRRESERERTILV